MLQQILSIARNALVESLRQPIFLMMVLLCGVLQFFTTWSTGFAMGYDESSEVTGDNKLLLDIGMATIFVMGMLLAAFIATAVLSREIENKTVLTVVSKPVGRPTLLVGKYLGVSTAILIAVATMLIFLMFGIRHGVMSTAADDIDQPVMLFSLSAVFLSLAIATWCNFFYGWSFPQVSVLLMLPFSLLAYLIVLSLSKAWAWQPIFTDFKPQVLMAAVCLVIAVLVLTAVAVAASTRLSQVTTIVTCAAVFLGALLVNHFVGNRAFKNQLITVIKEAAPLQPEQAEFAHAGDTYRVTLGTPPAKPIKVGESFYYGPSPSGAFLSVPAFEPFQGNLAETTSILGPDARPAVVITAVEKDVLTVRNLGARPVAVKRPPFAGDFVFLTPTKVSLAALGVWAIFPNMQYFWLLDAVTQNNPIPLDHVILIALYGLAQIVACLALGVILFQRRDVG